MGSQEGRAYCTQGQRWLTKSESNSRLLRVCRECGHIRFIGCPGVHPSAEACASDTRNWIDWWYWDEPIKDNNSQSSNQTTKGDNND